MDFQQQQLSLSQMYQQQRIAELQMVQQRHLEMMSQNQNRFTEMRDRFLATSLPMGGIPVTADLMGRQISQFGGGPARQSLFGAAIDANASFLQGRLLFRRAGFQFGTATGLVQERAREQLSVFGSQMGNVALDALVPQFLQQAMGRVGLGNIQEDSLALSDAFAGIRGAGSDTFNRRGIRGTRAADEYQSFVKGLNRTYDGMLSDTEIRTVGKAAISSLDDRQLEQAAAGGKGSIERLLQQQVRKLEEVAKNTGMSVDKMATLIEENKSLGNDIGTLVSAGRMVENFGASSGASRFRQLQTALQLTAQGRQLNVGDAGAFASDQFSRINDLVRGFTRGSISRAELFRFGGSDAFEAATRVQNQMLQQGAGFAQRETGRLGVLGDRAFAAQRAGFFGSTQETIAAYAANPFAGLNARFDNKSLQTILQGSPELAFLQAKNEVDLVKDIYPDDLTRTNAIKSAYASTMGVSDLEAGRQVDQLMRQDNQINSIIGGMLGQFEGLDENAVRKNIYAQLDNIRQAGISPIEVLRDPKFAAMLMGSPTIGDIKAFQIRDSAKDTMDTAYEKLKNYRIKSHKYAYPVHIPGVTQSHRAIGRDALGSDMATFARHLAYNSQEFGVTADDIVKEIRQQAERDGTQELEDAEQVKNKLLRGNEDVFATLDTSQREYMRNYLASVFVNRQLINTDTAKADGSSPGAALWIRMADKQ